MTHAHPAEAIRTRSSLRERVQALPREQVLFLVGISPEISGAVFFVYGERGQPSERPVNNTFYAVAHEPKEIWEVSGSKHIRGTEAQPQEYERRVTAFFDRE